MSTRRRLTAAILLYLVAMPLWSGGVRAKEVDSLTAGLFMLEPQYQRTLQQLDGNTLQTIGGIPLGGVLMSPSVTSRDIVPSPDGSHIAVVTYGRTPIYARYITIRVFDDSGLQLARFHPQVPITVGAISNDGKSIEGARIELVAQAFRGEQVVWTGPAADSSAVYVLTTKDPNIGVDSSPEPLFTLRRLDPNSLQTTAERTFDGFNPPQLFILG